jgi:Amiloride-sensitive sodium channel
VVMLHNNTQLPLVDRAGIHLAPGRQYKLGYTKKTNVLLPSPYTKCKDKVTLGMQAMFDQFSGANYVYSEEICFKVAKETYTYV